MSAIGSAAPAAPARPLGPRAPGLHPLPKEPRPAEPRRAPPGAPPPALSAPGPARTSCPAPALRAPAPARTACSAPALSDGAPRAPPPRLPASKAPKTLVAHFSWERAPRLALCVDGYLLSCRSSLFYLNSDKRCDVFLTLKIKLRLCDYKLAGVFSWTSGVMFISKSRNAKDKGCVFEVTFVYAE